MFKKRDREEKSFIMDGIILFDKPSGFTSHDIVEIVRNKTKIKKVGHSGSLDPMATGLLIILIGVSTKKQSEFQMMDKVYDGEIELGVITDTWDMEGNIIKRVEDLSLDKTSIEKAISLFDGTITQVVPPYSAVKYKGKTLYKLARKKQPIPTIRKTVRVKWLNWKYLDGKIKFKIKCSSGTYVRSIAYELGQILGCGATLSSLRRTEIGNYSIKDAISINEFEKMSLKDIERVIIKLR